VQLRRVLEEAGTGAVEQECVAKRREAGIERGGTGRLRPPILPALDHLPPAGGGQRPDQELASSRIEIRARPIEGHDRVVLDAGGQHVRDPVLPHRDLGERPGAVRVGIGTPGLEPAILDAGEAERGHLLAEARRRAGVLVPAGMVGAIALRDREQVAAGDRSGRLGLADRLDDVAAQSRWHPVVGITAIDRLDQAATSPGTRIGPWAKSAFADSQSKAWFRYTQAARGKATAYQSLPISAAGSGDTTSIRGPGIGRGRSG